MLTAQHWALTRAGCDCLPTWSYTTTTGTTYNITNGTCQNPGREWSTDWCYVNPLSCAHRPFLANGAIVTQAWDTCMGPNLNKSIDSGVAPGSSTRRLPGLAVLPLVHPVPCACRPIYSHLGVREGCARVLVMQ